MSGYLYIVREREFVRAAEPVWKVGRTSTTNCKGRMVQYPTHSEMCFASSVRNAKSAERALVDACSAHPSLLRRTDIGNEYFEGSLAIVKQLAHMTALLFCPDLDAAPPQSKCDLVAPDLEELLNEAFDCTAGPRSFVTFRELYDTLVLHGVGTSRRKVDMTERSFAHALTRLGHPSGTSRLPKTDKAASGTAKVRFGLARRT